MSLTAQYPSVYPRFDIKENVKFIKDDGTVVYLNNVEGDTVVEFELIQKKGNFFQAKANVYLLPDCFSIGSGLIPDTEYIVTLIRVPLDFIVETYGKSNDIRLYTTPDNKGVYEICENPGEAKVVDVDGKWLKIEFERDGSVFQGWIPEEEQCHDPWSACTG